MRELDRISRLFRLLIDTYTRPVSLSTLQEKLDGASSATVKRDIAFLRDSMFVPITYDREANGYYIPKDDNNNKWIGYSVPGLWITADEAYAFLTLYNVLRKIDPGVLGPLVEPLRRIFKRILSDSQHRLYGLDKKIRIELDVPKLETGAVMGELSFALANGDSVALTFVDGSGLVDGRYHLEHLTLKANGWFLTAVLGHREPEINGVEMPVRNIRTCVRCVDPDRDWEPDVFPAD